MIQVIEQQRTFEWRRDRLGNFTGSQVGDLMVSGRKKEEVFGGTAMNYIMEVAAERGLLPDVTQNYDIFQEYDNICGVGQTRAMRWGTEQEAVAKEILEHQYPEWTIQEIGFTLHKTVAHFGASPDGLILLPNGKRKVLEVKCPIPTTFLKYKTEIKDGETLKMVNSLYYWQIQAEMAVTGCTEALFYVYCPFMKVPIHAVGIEQNEADIAALIERVELANKYIKEHFNFD